jgi:hypothetical protein
MEPEPDLSEEVIETSISELSDEFARRVGALADLFASWRQPEVARAVIESMIWGDGEAFRDLQGDLDFPTLGRCVWLSEVIETITRSRSEEVCRLRTDLSPDERRRYLALALYYSQRGEMPYVEAGPSTVFYRISPGPVIPPGPFLTALKAEGLVTCAPESVGGGLGLVIGPPSRVCL